MSKESKGILMHLSGDDLITPRKLVDTRFICDNCGKKNFNSQNAVKRHKKRSKICKATAPLYKSEQDLSKMMNKLGMVLTTNKVN